MKCFRSCVNVSENSVYQKFISLTSFFLIRLLFRYNFVVDFFVGYLGFCYCPRDVGDWIRLHLAHFSLGQSILSVVFYVRRSTTSCLGPSLFERVHLFSVVTFCMFFDIASPISSLV